MSKQLLDHFLFILKNKRSSLFNIHFICELFHRLMNTKMEGKEVLPISKEELIQI